MRRANLALVTVGSIARGISQWFAVWVIAQAYGAVELGQYSLVLAGATPVFVAANLGLRNVYVSLQNAPAWPRFVRWRLVGMGTGAALLIVYGAVAAPFWGIVVGMLLMKCADGLLDIVLARLQYQQRYSSLGAITIANAVGSMLVMSLAAILGAHPGVLIALSGFVSALLIGPAMALSRVSVEVLTERGAGFREVLRAAIPITLSTGMMSLVSSVPIWYLEIASTGLAVGAYSAASYLVVAANLVGASLQTVLISAYRNVRESRGDSAVQARGRRHVAFLMALSIPAIGICVFLGDHALVFVYGSEFHIGKPALLLLAAAATFCVLGYVQSTLLLALNMYNSQMVVAALSLIASVVPPLVSVALQFEVGVVTAMASIGCAYLARFVLAYVLVGWRAVRR